MILSARNVLAGTVTGIIRGSVNAEVNLELRGGTPLAVIVTNSSVERLALAEGKEVSAIVKASSIIVGTDLHNAKVSARNILCGAVSRLLEGAVNDEIEIEMAG